MTHDEVLKELSYTVAMANELIQRSRYELTKTEQKAVLYMASKIKPDDEPNTRYVFSIKAFCQICNLNKNSGTYYQYLQDMMLGLAKQPLKIPHKDGVVITHWFNDVLISRTSDRIVITFSDYLKPFLFALKNRYTSFYLENVLPMKSGYGIRIYEYIKSRSYNERKFMISLDELRAAVGCEGRYNQFSELRIYVIEPALKDINTFTDIKVEYKAIKSGKKVSCVEFSIIPFDEFDATDRHLNRIDALGLRETAKEPDMLDDLPY